MRLIFETFEIDPDGGQLLRDGAQVPLEPRAFDLLHYLASHPQRLIERDELVAQVWRARALSQGVLANTVAKLRRALGQASDAQEPIETVRGRGYRWRAIARAASMVDTRGPSAVRDPFVGRAQAQAQLSAALARSAQGVAQLVCVAGEAGIGKTRVVRELETHARKAAFEVWRGAAYDGEAAPPYWPWVELLRAAHELLGPVVWRRHLSAGHAALSELVPELFGKSFHANTGTPTSRFALFDEASHFLRSASKQAPLLLVLEDLHWADAGTLDLLSHATRALERQPVLLVVTLRDREAFLDEQASSSWRRLARNARSIALEGLSEAEVVELVSALDDGAGEPSELAAALHARTQGNPLFIRQILELLAQRDQLRATSARELAIRELPLAVRSVIQQRIDLLGDATCEVLAAAALGGAEFDASLLAEVLDHPLQALLAAIEPALRLGVVEQRAAAAPHRFAFTHSLVCDALSDGLGAARRGDLHARFARVLSARSPAGDARQLAELARHSLSAVPSDLRACVLECRRAAAAARASSGFEAAANLLARLVEKHESQGGDARERCELLFSLATDQLCAGALRPGWKTLRRGAELARALDAPALLAQFALRLGRYLETGGGDEPYVRAILEQALSSLSPSESGLRSALLAASAELDSQRPFEARRALLAEAEVLATQRDAPGLLRQVAYAHVVIPGPLCPAQRRAAVRRFRALDAQSDRSGVDPVRVYHAVTVELAEYALAHTVGDLEAALNALARCRELVARANLTVLALRVQLAEAGRALAASRFEDVAAHVQRSREYAEEGGLFGLSWTYYAARILIDRGQAAALLSGSLTIDPGRFEIPERLRVPMALYRAWFGVQLGQGDDAARALAEISRAMLATLPASPGDLGLMCALAETYHALGQRDGAARLLPQLEPFASFNAMGNNFECYGTVNHYLGLLARLLDEKAAAATYFERAIEANRSLHMPLHLARSEAQRAAF